MENELAAREIPTETSMPEPSTVPEPPHDPETGAVRPAREKRRRVRYIDPIRDIPPLEVCGKWVAWRGRHIVASGETFAEVRQKVESAKIKGASYELIPPANVRF